MLSLKSLDVKYTFYLLPQIETMKIDQSWTLFLDRDGVINKRIPDDYVRNISQFSFLTGSLKAIVQLNNLFGLVVVVTNQQGIGKGLMTQEDVDSVHDYLIRQVEKAGGCIERVYTCPALAKDNAICRKPKLGMGLQAKEDFPLIDFKRSVMVGDSISDMEFGIGLGMKTVFIETKTDIDAAKIPVVDYRFSSLWDFARSFQFIDVGLVDS